MRFFEVADVDGLILRSDEAGTDEAFLRGAWQRTRLVGDYLFGHADDVEPITEARARQLAPAAFDGSPA